MQDEGDTKALSTIRELLGQPVSEEQRALARAAVEAMGARRDEDVEEWARRIAADVAEAND